MNERIKSQIMEVMVEEEKTFWADQHHLLRVAEKRHDPVMQKVVAERMEEEQVSIAYDKLLDDLENDRITADDFKVEEGGKL